MALGFLIFYFSHFLCVHAIWVEHYEILDSSSVVGTSYFLNRKRTDPDLHHLSSINASITTIQVRLFNESYTLLLHHDPGSIIAPDFQAFKVLPNGSILILYQSTLIPVIVNAIF